MSTCPRLSLIGACALAGAVLVGCSDQPGDGPSSAVLITLDTTRWDALSCYGVSKGTTPFFDEMAREGVLYLNARASAPLTLPSHASMLTGLYPPRHGLRNNGLGALPQAAETLAERARARHFATGAFVAAVVLDDAFGLDQGFERYDSPRRSFVETDSDYAERCAGEVVDAALGWIASLDPSRPFFLWVHLFDAHGPHEPHPEFADSASDYLAEVSYMDAQVRRLMQGVREGTGGMPLTLVVGDHGEALGEHDEPTHGTFCYDGTLRVPMILRYPDGYGAGERVEAPTSVVDVYPTLLEGMGLGLARDVDGVSLFRREPESQRGVYFESYYGYFAYGWSPLSGWADSAGKYVHSSEPEFFAIAEDSRELRDVSAERGGGLERYLAPIRRLAEMPSLASDTEPAADPELAARIRSLGYAGSTATDSELPGIAAQGSGLPAPRRSAAEHKAVMQAQELINQGHDYDAAEALLRGLLASNPRNSMALDELGRCLMLQNQHDEAAQVLARALADRPRWPQTLINLSICMALLGRNEEALACLSRALEVDPNESKALTNMALLLEQLGRADEAAPFRERFHTLTGRELPRAPADLRSAMRLLDEGNAQGAIALLEALLAREPEDLQVLLGLQRAYRQKGELDRAIDLLAEALRRNPLADMLHLSLADAYLSQARLGPEKPDVLRLELALESIQRACELGPGSAAAHGLRGDILSELARSAPATEAYVQAADLDRSSVARLGKAARALSDAGRWGEAVRLLRRIEALQPDSPHTLFLLGAALANSGELEEAAAALERATRLAPDNQTFLDTLERIRSALATPPAAKAGGNQDG